MTLALSVKGLGKRYQLGTGGGYTTLREAISGTVGNLFNRQSAGREFWALRDVSFDVEAGETVGIIGRNGAGKSTLLKILSRITAPTEGRAEIHGRVSSLLEVGTGFHPELTGRENIFLNGTILGMTRSEVKANLDAIIDFAEIEEFLDTPVKRYSSGMYMRLAFAVAAHLRTDVMIVDEVLAVGDAKFQKKCIGRMQNAAGSGRTVLFVSHNMSALAQLCRRGIVLDAGKVVQDGPVQQAIAFHISGAGGVSSTMEFPADPNKELQVRRIWTASTDGKENADLDRGQPFDVVVEVEARNALQFAVILAVSSDGGTRLLRTVSADSLKAFSQAVPGRRMRFSARIPGGILNEGSYSVRTWVVPGSTGVYDTADSGLFTLRDPEGLVSFIGDRKTDTSLLRLPVEWHVS